MADGVPTDPPNTRSISLASVIRKLWGDEWLKRETVYEFSNKREFKSTDQGTSGIYRGTG